MDLFTLVGKIVLEADEFNTKVDSVMSKVESVAGGIQKVGDKVSTVGSGLTKAVTVPLAAVGGASVRMAATFEDAMLKVQSLSGASQEEYAQLSAAAKQYGATTAWTAKDVADAMGYMALAGFDTSDILASVGGMLSLASASGEDLATVTDILTDSMTAFGDGAADASRYADVLATAQAKSNTTVGQLGESFKYVAPLAGAYGYKLEDVTAALGMMANAGVKGTMSGTALSSIITRLGTNVNGARDAVEALGVQFYNSDGTARNLSDVLKDLCDATANMDTAQKAELATTVAGQEAQKGLLAILNQGSAAYEDLEGKIKNCDGTASDMAQNMESGMGGSIRSLKSALEGLSITIGEKLAPYIEKAAQKIKEFTQWFQNLDAGTQETIIKMGLLLVAVGPVLTIFGKGISVIGSILSVGSKLVGGIKTVVSVGSTLISGAKLLIGVFTGLNPVVLAVGAAIGVVVAAGVAIYKNWDKIKEKAQQLKEGIIAAWQGIKAGVQVAVEAIGNIVSQIWSGIKQGVIALKDGIIAAWQGIKAGVQVAAEALGKGVSQVWSGIKQGAAVLKDGIIAAWQGIKTGVQVAAEALGKGVSKVWSGIKQLSSDVKDSIVGHWQNIKDGIHTAAEVAKETVVNKFQELKEKVSSRITELKDNTLAKFRELKENASSRIHELKENVTSKFRELKENTSVKVSEMRENVVTNFKNLKEQATEKISDLKERWGQHFEEARGKIVSEVTELKEKATAKITEFKDNAIQKFKDLKDAAGSSLANIAKNGVEGFQSIRDKGSAAIEKLKDVAANKFAEMGNAVREKFSTVGEKITGTFSKCQEKVKGIVDSIKGFFKFDWKLPKIKLPHFKMEGKFSLNPPSIPHFGVEWYANGGIMTKPTAFGINPGTGNMMVGGEAGAEAIAPITVLQEYIRQAVGAQNQEIVNVLTAVLGALNRYLPQCAEKQLVLDTGATVGALAAGMNTKLGEISRQDERIK